MTKLPEDLLTDIEFRLEHARVMFVGGKDANGKFDHGRIMSNGFCG